MKGKSIASMVCGIASIVCCWMGYGAVAGLICGIVALVLSSGCVKEGYENQFTKVAKITGIIGLILSAIGLVVSIACTACGTAASLMSNY